MNINFAIWIYLHIFLCITLIKNLSAIVVPEVNINISQVVTSSQPNFNSSNISTLTVSTSSKLDSKTFNISTSTVSKSSQPKLSDISTTISTSSQLNPTAKPHPFPDVFPTKKNPSTQSTSKPTISTRHNLKLFNINTNLLGLQCIRYFVYTFLSYDSERVTVIINEHENPGLSYTYISQLQFSQIDQQIKLSLYVLDIRYPDVKKTKFLSNSVVIILQDHNTLLELSVNLSDLCAHDCKFAIFLTSRYTEQSSFTEEAKKLVELMWIKKISNVVIIGQVEGIFLAAESSHFQPNLLPQPIDPAIIGRCTKKLWRVDRPLYSAMKMNNCSVNIGYFNEQMYSHKNIKNNETVVEGLEVSMIDAIGQALNFTAYLSMMEWDGKITKVDAASNKFKEDDSTDFIIGNIHCNDDDNNDCTIAFESASLIWLVPVKSRLSLTGLITPLEMKIWIAIGAIAIYTIFFKLLLFKKMSFLEILALFLGVAWDKQPQLLSYRLKFMSLIIFGFILSQYYAASLASSLFSGSRSKLNTVEELLNSTFDIGGQSYLIQLFDYDESYEFDDKKIIYNKFIGLDIDSYNKKLHDTMSGKDSSMALIVLLNISSFETQFSPDYVYVLPESVITLSLGFSVRPDLSYFSEIDRILLDLVENGIIGAMGRKLSPVVWFDQGDEESTNSEDFIRFENLYPCFLLLITGNLLSIFCLICEIVSFKHKTFNDTRRLKKSREKSEVLRIKKVKKPRQRILFNKKLLEQKFKWIE